MFLWVIKIALKQSIEPGLHALPKSFFLWLDGGSLK